MGNLSDSLAISASGMRAAITGLIFPSDRRSNKVAMSSLNQAGLRRLSVWMLYGTILLPLGDRTRSSVHFIW